MTSSEYPDYKKQETRTLTIADFPARVKYYSAESKQYWKQHHIDINSVNLEKTVYPTERGICFTMWGAVCFQERITLSNWPMRFWSPAGAPLGKVLYAPHIPTVIDTTVFVVEGLTDALAVHQSGYKAVALVGAKVSEQQLAMLKTLLVTKRLILIPDNDEAGEQCTKMLVKELPIAVRYLPSQYKDVSDIDISFRNSFLAGAIR